MEIGVIADTHGHVNPKVYDIFAGVDQILHAGDIGGVDIITSLETLAPVQAVYGNVDTFPISTNYPETLTTQIAGVNICMTHIYTGLESNLVQEALKQLPGQRLDLLIYGHSHQAKLERVGNTYLFNPGSAGRKRFSVRPAVGLLKITESGACLPQIIYLE
ncbi:MAG: metallophosphoesterase [Caldithrix sp.]|nr:MAG: metallophosphoesterase [Caldithrix sp.]